MADIDHANPSPIGGKDVKNMDIKQASIQVQPVVATPTFTPALTPDEDDIEAMAGKKLFSLERPDDKARELVKKLTLEEQVRGGISLISEELGPPQSSTQPFYETQLVY
jgi:beta-glucosidase